MPFGPHPEAPDVHSLRNHTLLATHQACVPHTRRLRNIVSAQPGRHARDKVCSLVTTYCVESTLFTKLFGGPASVHGSLNSLSRHPYIYIPITFSLMISVAPCPHPHRHDPHGLILNPEPKILSPVPYILHPTFHFLTLNHKFRILNRKP